LDLVVGSGEDAKENDKDVANLAAGNLYFIWNVVNGNSNCNSTAIEISFYILLYSEKMKTKWFPR
jgi:hypothetical protein